MKQKQDGSVEINDCQQTAILGQAHAPKFAWLPSINIQFKTIDARWFVLNAKWFVRRYRRGWEAISFRVKNVTQFCFVPRRYLVTKCTPKLQQIRAIKQTFRLELSIKKARKTKFTTIIKN